MEYLGTEYGGWLVDLNLITENSTVISAGVGEDISFDLELINRKNCNIIGIYPTRKSHKFIESKTDLENFSLIKKALDGESNTLVTMYENSNPMYVSESILPSHHSIKQFQNYIVETVSLDELFNMYDNISLIKMDIEGSEYNVIEALTGIPDSIKQICAEFHHFCTDYTIEHTQKMIKSLETFGFSKCLQNKPNSRYPYAELTFIRQ